MCISTVQLLTRICDSSHCRLHSEAKKKKRSEKLQEQLVAAAEEEEDNASAIDKDIKKYKVPVLWTNTTRLFILSA